MTGRHMRETVFAAFLGLLVGVLLHFVTGTDLAADESVDPLPRAVLEDNLSRSVMRADVVACEVHRQGSVTILDATASSHEGPLVRSRSRDSAEGPTLVTNAHVVQGAERAVLSGARLGVQESEVADFVEGRDAATLVLATDSVEGGTGLVPGPTPDVGDPVVLAGFPEGRWTVQDATVQSIEPRSGWGATSAVMVLDAPIQQGISGGVVVDLEGRAVGLVAARDPGTSHAVAYPVEDLLEAEPGRTPGC